ncbi:MAG: ATP-binding protein [Bdellovibrio sp.]|nr:ATP-binding protein [Bdellovibrio sp.]
MVNRLISSPILNSKKSILLLGPRQAGKSTLIQSLNPDLTIQLADQMEFFTFSANPNELRTRIETENPRTVFIDEVQRLPGILNTVQSLLDTPQAKKRGLKFYLTGSSARKLKRGGANLLPGRVLNFHLGPLVSSEIKYHADTDKLLSKGGLPEVYLEKDEKLSQHLLRSYVSNYIQEEIKAEALVRNLEAFTRFTQVAIQQAGLFIDYSKMAKQAKVSRHSLDRFYEIFEDTLIGQRVWPFEPCLEKADLIKHPKFYLFDNGVFNAVMGNFKVSPDRLGILAEQLIFTQILHSSWASLKDVKISTFRTRGGLEVDFIVELDGIVFGIEVKGSSDIQDHDARSLVQFKDYYPKCQETWVLHMGSKSRKIGNVWAHPWQVGLQKMGI